MIYNFSGKGTKKNAQIQKKTSKKFTFMRFLWCLGCVEWQ